MRIARWLGGLASACGLVALALVRLGDPFGDRGMRNLLSGFALAVLALGALVTFVCATRIAARTRVVSIAALAFALLGAVAVVRVQGVSGELVPHLTWRWGGSARSAPAATSVHRLALEPSAPSDFAAFLGPRRDGSVPDARLARDWEREPPRLRWRAPIGAGWSAFAVAGGYAFTLEQDEGGQRASARAALDGALGWSVVLDEPFRHVLGGDGPRATPAVELGPAPGEGRVYALTAHGRLACLAAESGELLWSHDLPAEHGLSRAEELAHTSYGRSNSPLVVGELVIVPAGGDAGLVAFDRTSGAERWASPARQVSQSSPAFATLAGVPEVVCVNEGSLSAHALADGRLLWEHPWPGQTNGDASVSQALPLPPARVLVSKGYGSGALLLELAPVLPDAASGALAVRDVWHDGRVLRTKFTNVVVHDGFVYGLDDGMLECVELASGERRWKDGRYGHGQLLLAGELLLVVSEEGEVLLIEADPARPDSVLGRFQGLTGKCWANLALADGVLFLRNAEECAAWILPRTR